jgi:hypothetical protein
MSHITFRNFDSFVPSSAKPEPFTFYDIEDRRIAVPNFTSGDRYGQGELMNSEVRDALARSYFDFINLTRSTFGVNQVGYIGPLTGQVAKREVGGPSTFYLSALGSSLEKIRDTIKSQGSLDEKSEYRLDRRDGAHRMFSVDEGCVFGFTNKTSPFRIAAGRIDSAWIPRFDKAIGEYAQPDKDSFTIEEMSKILVETRKYAKEILASVNIDITDDNISHLLQFLQVKSLRVIKESLIGMPYLKKERNLEKNLALMVDRGLTYERMLIFNIKDIYPEDEEELDMHLSTPHNWSLKLLG